MPCCPTNHFSLDSPTSASSTKVPSSRKRTTRPRQSQAANQLQKEQAEHEVGKLRNINGEIPYANRHLLHALDPDSGLLYLYGGETPDTVAADLHVLDMKSMECSNLSKSLRVRRPLSPWSAEETNKVKSGLPVLDQPGFTFLSFEGTPFLLFFGGHRMADGQHVEGEPDEGNDGLHVGPSSAVFFVRVGIEEPYWWREEEIQGNVQPRVNPSIVAINKEIFVFGGTKELPRSKEDKPEQICSFSILEFVDKTRKWTWTHRDVPYNVPNLIFSDLVPIYDGSSILLTPGRESLASEYEFTQENMWFFDTKKLCLEPVATVANTHFPKKLNWYYIHRFRPPPRENSATLAISSSSRRASRSSNSHPYPSGLHDCLSLSECVVISGWVVADDDRRSVSLELWKFSLFTRKFEHYKIPDDVLDFSGMRRFAVIDHRMYLFGDKDGRGDRKPRKDNSINYLFNTCIEMSPAIWSAV